MIGSSALCGGPDLLRGSSSRPAMDATMGSIAPTGLKGKLAALEVQSPRLFCFKHRAAALAASRSWQDFISMQNEELAAQRQELALTSFFQEAQPSCIARSGNREPPW